VDLERCAAANPGAGQRDLRRQLIWRSARPSGVDATEFLRPARLVMDQLLPAKDWKVLLSTAGWREQEHLAGPVTLPPYAVCILEAV